jgi:hypothetical protein
MLGEEAMSKPVDPDKRVQLHDAGDVPRLEPGHHKMANQNSQTIPFPNKIATPPPSIYKKNTNSGFKKNLHIYYCKP